MLGATAGTALSLQVMRKPRSSMIVIVLLKSWSERNFNWIRRTFQQVSKIWDVKRFTYGIAGFGISHGHEWTLNNNIDRIFCSRRRVKIPAKAHKLAKVLRFLIAG